MATGCDSEGSDDAREGQGGGGQPSYYASGVGPVLAVAVSGAGSREELLEYRRGSG